MDPFFEDLHVGYSAKSQPMTIRKSEIVEFAAKWDPQPFHIDETASKDSFFGKLVACGAHTFAITMRLGVDCRVLTGNTVAGLGIDKMRFLAPLPPDSTVTATFTVESLRLSASKKGFGVVHWTTVTSDQNEKPVFSAVFINLCRCRGN
jgi:acyl dehydratase